MTRKKPPETKTPRSRDDFLISTREEVDEAVTTSGKSSKSKITATLASKADKLELYEGSVQEPRKECRNLEAIYKDLTGTMPRILREDFCSTAMIAMAWLQSPDVLRKSIGVDIDPVMIKRAEEIRNRDNVSRITLVQASVLDEHTAPSADLIAALNYAIFYFHKRGDAVKYLRLSRDRLRQNGCIILDLFGGESDVRSGKKRIRTNAEGVEYWLEESQRDLLTNTVKLALSFRMRDGSWVKNAFIYDFRVYSIAEVSRKRKGYFVNDRYWK